MNAKPWRWVRQQHLQIGVLVGIVGLAVALFLVALLRFRESARDHECRHNLRSIGTALLAYQKQHGQLPPYYVTEPGTKPKTLKTLRSLFWLIRPFLEPDQSQQTKAIRLYLCPSRRGSEVGTKFDYGLFNSFLSQAPGRSSIFLPGRRPVYFSTWTTDPGGPYTLSDIPDGAANTILMAHKGLDPEFYHQPPTDPPSFTGAPKESIAAARDFGWQPFRLGDYIADPPTGDLPMWGILWDVGRYPFAFLRDKPGGYFVDEFLLWEWYDMPEKVPCYSFMTSPHPEAMPILWADGSVRPQNYTTDYRLSVRLIAGSQWRVAPSKEVLFMASLWMMNDSDFEELR